MRKSMLRLYAPFIALALLQGVIVLVAPSTGDPQDVATFGEFDEDFRGSGPGGGGPGGSGDFDEDFDGDFETGGPGETGGPDGTGGPGGPGAASPGGGAGGDPAAGGDGAPGGGGGGGGGDTSHCTDDGRQHGVTYHAPACVPRWEGGDNGGATYPGVTADSVKVVLFSSQPNEQVDAILAREGLAASEQEQREFLEASTEFLHKHYEFYGRKIEFVRVVGDCPTTPPDVARCRQAAQEVARMRPFAVVWGTPLYADVFDVWVRAGIVTIGGNHFEKRFYTARRPFRYDVFMDGTSSADVIAEYYCKKLAGQNATHSGRVIHPQIGTRGNVPRRAGIVVPEIPANVLNAQRVQQRIAQCDSGEDPIITTYESDIDRAAEQTRAVVAALIQNRVTTVICMCDPIAPVFGTAGMTANSYFPEHLLPGLGLLDYDKLGRLYDDQQMQHMFGPSHLGNAVPHEESDATKIWRDVGRGGTPCLACNGPWAYFSLVGTIIQSAGPDLNPGTVERGMLTAEARGGWDQTGGRGDIVMINFGQDDYTGLSDYREVYWSANARSQLDGRAGAYVPMNDGRRYRLGQLPGGFNIPVGS
jgi:hypothetical protein